MKIIENIFKPLDNWSRVLFWGVFILVGMHSVFGLKSIQFDTKIILRPKVLKNAQNGSGEAIVRVLRG